MSLIQQAHRCDIRWEGGGREGGRDGGREDGEEGGRDGGIDGMKG